MRAVAAALLVAAAAGVVGIAAGVFVSRAKDARRSEPLTAEQLGDAMADVVVDELEAAAPHLDAEARTSLAKFGAEAAKSMRDSLTAQVQLPPISGPSATVAVQLAGSTTERAGARVRVFAGLRAEARAVGEEVVTDLLGRATVSVPAGVPVQLAAMSRSGTVVWSKRSQVAPGSTTSLALSLPAARAQVRLVDARDDRPLAGVSVVLRQAFAFPAPRGVRKTSSQSVETTDVDGRAGRGGLDPSAWLGVYVNSALNAGRWRADVWFDPNEWGDADAPPLVRATPLALLTVNATDAETGETVRVSRMTLWRRNEDGTAIAVEYLGQITADGIWPPHGTVEFPLTGTQDVFAAASGYEPVSVTVQPDRDGRMTWNARLTRAPLVPRLRVRVRREDGRAITRGHVQQWFVGRSQGWHTLELESEGVYSAEFDALIGLNRLRLAGLDGDRGYPPRPMEHVDVFVPAPTTADDPPIVHEIVLPE